MNQNSQVFAHQSRIAEGLSRYFESTFVITAESIAPFTQKSMKVMSTNWVSGKKIRNVFSFYKISLPILFKNKRSVVFFHMTDVQCALVAPFCYIFGIRHYIWYAHRSLSPYLLFSYAFVDGVITSTKGSIPFNGKKMSYVGQSIDEHLGSGIDVNYEETPTRFYHIGRLDPSKNIELIIEVLDWYRRRIRGITLDLYGINSSWKSAWYAKDLLQKFTNGKYKEWIRFKGPITNKEIDKISQDYDVFIHGFGGSLDKALVEATVMKRFVITPNREYLQSFELDFDSMKNPKELMKEQLSKLQEMTSHELATEVSRRADIAISKHSLQNWLALTTQILTSNYGK